MREKYMTCVDMRCFIGFILALVAAVAVGVLFAFGYIPLITVGIWILLGIAILNLVLLFVGAYRAVETADYPILRCLCGAVGCIATGSIGAIIAAVAALSAGLLAASIHSVVLAALVVFFIVIALAGDIGFLGCILDEACDECECECECDRCMRV